MNFVRIMAKTETERVGDKTKSQARRKTLPNSYSKSNTAKKNKKKHLSQIKWQNEIFTIKERITIKGQKWNIV